MSREQNMATLGQLPAEQKMWVGNLTPETTAEEVDAHFRQLGEPVVAEILKKGNACVGYSTAEEAETAISAFNGSEINGAAIQTDVWTQKPAGGKKGGAAKGGAKGGFEKGGYGKADTFGVITPSQQKGMKGVFGEKGVYGAAGGKGKAAWGAPAWGAAPAAWGAAAAPSPYGKGKAFAGKGGFAAPAAAPVVAASVAQVFQVTVGENALTQQGYAPESVAAVYEKGNEAFSYGAHILADIIDDVAAEVEIVHDADWEQFPDIGEAVKAASGEDHCLAIGICASRSKWAIGCGSGWKGRENATKVALSVALAIEDPEIAGRLAKNYPDFGRILKSQGMAVSVGASVDSWKKSKGGAGLGQAGQADWEEPQLSGETPSLHLVALTQESKLTTEGYPADAPAVLHGGKAQKLYFSNAHSILSELLEDISEVQFQDDADGDVLPEVGAALSAAGAEENGYCVATCPSQAVWGIGMANGWKTRETAAKMGLAIAVAQAQGKIEALAATYPEFGEVCATVGLCEAAAAPPAKKQRAW